LTGKSGNVSKRWLKLLDNGLVRSADDLLQDGISFAISSSRTLMDRAFSFLICVESMAATDGMVDGRRVGREKRGF